MRNGLLCRQGILGIFGTFGALALIVVAAIPVGAQTDSARAVLHAPDGDEVGMAYLTETNEDAVLVDVRLDGIASGAHALHIHETGSCSPDFSAAGGHHAPGGESHGMLHGKGGHAGDLRNIHVEDGRDGVRVEQVAFEISLDESATGTLFDEDGSAIVIHEGPDDYRSQPSGDAGSRIACGVIER